MTKEYPLLFNDEMVRAILDGRKTQSRRPLKKQPQADRVAWGCVGGQGFGFVFGNASSVVRPPWGVGGTFWVRECWGLTAAEDKPPFKTGDILSGDAALLRDHMRLNVHYRATENSPGMYWRPNIHMPRWACRTTMPTTAVRVERLQDVTHEDAVAEGVEDVDHYRELWDSIYKSRGLGWDQNPWVWAGEWASLKPSD